MANNNNNNNSTPSSGRYVNLFTTKAYVFHVNPETRDSWIQTVKKAIDVSILGSKGGQNDKDQINGIHRREFKLYAVNEETGDIVLDDIISPRTTFDKRSQKFCQWMDNKRLLCGLGFDQEGPLEEFIQIIGQYQRELLQQQQQLQVHQHQQQQQQHFVGGDIQKASQQHQHANSQQANPQPNSQASVENVTPYSGGGVGQGGDSNNNSVQYQQTLEQIKYENERLKRTLEETSHNAGLWQNELMTLRTNNVKLRNALEESRSNVEEWQKELTSLRDENKELKVRVRSLESSSSLDQKHKKDLIEYKNYVEKMQKEIAIKDEDLNKLMDELSLSKQKSDDQANNNIPSLDSMDKQTLESVRDRLEAQLSELKSLSQDYNKVMENINKKSY